LPRKRAEAAAAPVKSMLKMVGPAVFYVGLLVAVVACLIQPTGLIYVALAILGVLVGLANVTAKETGPYLFASVAFIVTALGMQTLISAALPGLLVTYPEFTRLAANITIFVGSGAAIIALKAIWGIAKSE